MNEKIGVIIDFLTPAYEKTLRDTAARCGYDIVFFPSSKAAEGNVDDCTILYGHPSQRVIAGARNLKWYASCWAGAVGRGTHDAARVARALAAGI